MHTKISPTDLVAQNPAPPERSIRTWFWILTTNRIATMSFVLSGKAGMHDVEEDKDPLNMRTLAGVNSEWQRTSPLKQ